MAGPHHLAPACTPLASTSVAKLATTPADNVVAACALLNVVVACCAFHPVLLLAELHYRIPILAGQKLVLLATNALMPLRLAAKAKWPMTRWTTVWFSLIHHILGHMVQRYQGTT
jgi:hypothetical protein